MNIIKDFATLFPFLTLHVVSLLLWEKIYSLSHFFKNYYSIQTKHTLQDFFFFCLTPSLSWLQITYWKKISPTDFRQILPNILPVVHIFSFMIMTYLKTFIVIKSLITKQCPAELSSWIIPHISAILPKMFPLRSFCFSPPLFIDCFLSPLCMDCAAYSPKPTIRGKPCKWGKNPTQHQKNAHFPHHKNPPHQIVVFM